MVGEGIPSGKEGADNDGRALVEKRVGGKLHLSEAYLRNARNF